MVQAPLFPEAPCHPPAGLCHMGLQSGRMEDHLRQIQTPIWQRAIVLLTHGAGIPGGTTVEEHIQRKGKSLLWLVERCGNKFHVLDSQARDKEVQVQLLLEKMDRMVEINSHPREIQERLYSQVRESLRMDGGKQQGEDMDILVMQDMRTRQKQQVTAVVPIETSKRRPAAFGLVLLGRRFSGKNSARNTILGRPEQKNSAVCGGTGRGGREDSHSGGHSRLESLRSVQPEAGQTGDEAVHPCAPMG
ncbi:hypothetical protein J4Q44_G00334590 [Coregonus suidteri]|uniref:AIG1-type G domain-containing protein n=1 Tax=Coregonus suidteri TaxID=861788 RepID=A0AAN8QD88_9TELE